jgi:hypothetical protein
MLVHQIIGHGIPISLRPGLDCPPSRSARYRKFLTSELFRAYAVSIVGRFIRMVIVVLVAVAVATVLITPDQTDDDRALLRKCHL